MDIRARFPYGMGMLLVLVSCGFVTLAWSQERSLEMTEGMPAILSLEVQSCDGPATVGETRHPHEAEFRAAGSMPFGDTGYRIEFERLGSFREQIISERLHDTSRGVDDSYLLFRPGMAGPYQAAYVVTRMSPGREMAAKDFMQTAMEVQQRNAGGVTPSFGLTRTPLGDGIEMVVDGRVGSMCFPTSPFRYAKDPETGALGISRFITHGDALIEYALVLPWPAGVARETMIERARTALAPLQDAFRTQPSQ